MNICEQVAAHINDAYNGNNWTEVNLANTLADVNYTEAITVTKASPNTIAMLVHHLKFYNEIVLKRLQGSNPKLSNANGFDIPLIENEEQWKQLVEDCLQSAKKLAEATTVFPAEKLGSIPNDGHTTMYKNLHGIAEHAHYHIGQITIIKKLLRLRSCLN